MHIGFPSRERTRLIRFLRTLLALERRRAEVSQAKLPGHPSLPARMAGRSGRRGPETTETRPKRPCWGSLQRMSLRARSASLRVDSARRSSPGASSIIAGEPCAVIVVRPHELRDRRVRDVACFEFRVYAVSSRLKAELRAVSSTLCPPDQDGRGHRYASAYPRAGGIKAINSRPKAGILVRENVRENRISLKESPFRNGREPCGMRDKASINPGSP